MAVTKTQYGRFKVYYSDASGEAALKELTSSIHDDAIPFQNIQFISDTSAVAQVA